MANTYLSRTFSSGNTKTWTWSGWVKKSKIESFQTIFSAGTNANSINIDGGSGTENSAIGIDGFYNGTRHLRYTSSAYRDVNGWYHVVVAVDTTEATDSNRIKLWVNGSQVGLDESISGSYPSQNSDGVINSNVIHSIGRRENVPDGYFNGSMSHVHFIDGTAYDASAFGEYDANGVWKIKTSPSVTYGTNGFFILKNGNSVTDQSGNSNNFTVNGHGITNTEDCPSNVFATISPLYYSAEKAILEFGNLRRNGHAPGESAAWRSLFATLGNSSGKYYFETKIETSTAGNNFWIGIVDDEQIVATGDNGEFYNTSRGYAYGGQSGTKGNNGADASYGDTYTSNDIIGCAFDLDNHKIYWSKNGVWQNSGDPTSGATGTGSAFNLATGYTYIPSFATFNNDERYAINFGNGYFSTTAVASAGTNASGIGIFEYDVPTGYTALCTKGLNL